MSMDSIQFEAIKTALKQSKDGYVLTLSIHPDDIPDDLMRDFVGSRYVVVMVRLGDDERPINREAEFPGAHAVKLAGVLCRDSQFWDYLESREWLFEKNEASCVLWLHEYLGVDSRAELKNDPDARRLFTTLSNSFYDWKKK